VESKGRGPRAHLSCEVRGFLMPHVHGDLPELLAGSGSGVQPLTAWGKQPASQPWGCQAKMSPWSQGSVLWRWQTFLPVPAKPPWRARGLRGCSSGMTACEQESWESWWLQGPDFWVLTINHFGSQLTSDLPTGAHKHRRFSSPENFLPVFRILSRVIPCCRSNVWAVVGELEPPP